LTGVARRAGSDSFAENRCERLGFCALRLSFFRSDGTAEERTHVIGMRIVVVAFGPVVDALRLFRDSTPDLVCGIF
jgi:hypothetical protein